MMTCGYVPGLIAGCFQRVENFRKRHRKPYHPLGISVRGAKTVLYNLLPHRLFIKVR